MQNMSLIAYLAGNAGTVVAVGAGIALALKGEFEAAAAAMTGALVFSWYLYRWR